MFSSSYDSKTSDSNDERTPSLSTNKLAFLPRRDKNGLCKSWENGSNSTGCSSCQSDSSLSDQVPVKARKPHNRKKVVCLPRIGIFWDIENCQVPKNKSATSVVQRIRELFCPDYCEAEFLVVCDVKKESAQIILELNDAQVNLIHVSSTSKNAADEKLRQSLRRFAELHKTPAAVALISGDVNFAADLSDLRYRRKLHVILVHNSNVADALILCAHDTYNYSFITEDLPVLKNKTVTVVQQADLTITNLPLNQHKRRLKQRLKILSDNCGGRVITINEEQGCATLRFSSLDFAVR